MMATLIFAWLHGCLAPECAHGSFGSAECRVAAENHYARLVTQTGIELRFHAAPVPDVASWDAVGLFEEDADGTVTARPAGLADFALSLDGARLPATQAVRLRITNLAPDTTVAVGPLDALQPIALPDPPLLERGLLLQVPVDERIWVVGERPCPDRFRLLAAGDVQTNPVQFERIVQSLHDEVARGSEAGEPVLGMLLLGDLTENATEDEFRRIREILASSPVPVATTVGNHDVIGEELAIYNRLFGPGNHRFEVCGAQVAMVDSGNGDLAPSIEGRLPELLDAGEGASPLLVGTHYPPYPGRTGAGFADDAQAYTLLAEAVRQEGDLVLAGHVHTWREFADLSIAGGAIDQVITGTAGASQGGGQPHFGVTRVTLPSADFCFVEVPEPGRAPGDGGSGEGPLRRCPDVR
ncbi:MAG: metallophosphoesterase [Myxococcota bacterium]